MKNRYAVNGNLNSQRLLPRKGNGGNIPGLNELSKEIDEAGETYDIIRRKYIKKLAEYTGRNVIAMYSGFLQIHDQTYSLSGIDENDKNGLMACINKMDRNEGLDLILHTPGGGVADTESIVEYLHTLFDDFRVIVPQIAMSAGTMIACSADKIIMGKHSSLGPIDPLIMGINAHAILEEFETAKEQVQEDQALANVWAPIISKYPPTIIGEAKKGIEWSKSIVKEWLTNRMFIDSTKSVEEIDEIIIRLSDHSETLAHERHLSAKTINEIGLKVIMLEDDPKLQDLILSIHHAFMLTFANSSAIKIIENHLNVNYIQLSPYE